MGTYYPRLGIRTVVDKTEVKLFVTRNHSIVCFVQSVYVILLNSVIMHNYKRVYFNILVLITNIFFSLEVFEHIYYE